MSKRAPPRRSAPTITNQPFFERPPLKSSFSPPKNYDQETTRAQYRLKKYPTKCILISKKCCNINLSARCGRFFWHCISFSIKSGNFTDSPPEKLRCEEICARYTPRNCRKTFSRSIPRPEEFFWIFSFSLNTSKKLPRENIHKIQPRAAPQKTTMQWKSARDTAPKNVATLFWYCEHMGQLLFSCICIYLNVVFARNTA